MLILWSRRGSLALFVVTAAVACVPLLLAACGHDQTGSGSGQSIPADVRSPVSTDASPKEPNVGARQGDNTVGQPEGAKMNGTTSAVMEAGFGEALRSLSSQLEAEDTLDFQITRDSLHRASCIVRDFAGAERDVARRRLREVLTGFVARESLPRVTNCSTGWMKPEDLLWFDILDTLEAVGDRHDLPGLIARKQSQSVSAMVQKRIQSTVDRIEDRLRRESAEP